MKTRAFYSMYARLVQYLETDPCNPCTNDPERENPMNMSVDTEKAFREDQSIHS